MSKDDDSSSWFDGSSNSAEENGDPSGERRLEAVPTSSPATESQDWFDQLSDPSPDAGATAAQTDSRTVSPKALFVGLVLVVLVMLAGGAWFLASLLGGSESSSAAPLTAPTPVSPTDSADPRSEAVASGDCESTTSSTGTTGDGEGDTSSVAGVVEAFQHAYYVDRDAEKMEPLLSEESRITDLDALQEGIDSVARGTTHCLRVSPDEDGAASVELTEIAPDGTETVYEQRVTTTRESGEVRIVSIEEQS